MTSVSVIGLDGATHRLLDELDLPNISSLFDAGYGRENLTCLPMFTTPAWQCYARGADPSTVGIYNFMRSEITDRVSVSFVDSTDFRGVPIWRQLTRHGLSSCVLNLHNTHPVERINGVMVAEHADRTSADVFPPDIADLVTPEPDLSDLDGDARFDALLDIIRSRFDLAELVLSGRHFDFVHLSIFYIDSIQHDWWGDRYKLRVAWELIDERVGDLLPMLHEQDDETYVIVMSDHGHVGIKDRFYLNEWLERQGYLVRSAGGTIDNLHRVGVNRDRLERWVKRAGLLGVARRIVPIDVRRRIPDEKGDRPGAFELAGSVDVGRSTAFYPGGDQIHVLDPSKIDGLIDELAAIKHPETGDRILDAVYRSDKLYENPGEGTPEIILHPDAYRISQHGDGRLWGHEDESGWRSMHDRRGIFTVAGPGINPVDSVVSIFDISPTILALLGVPVPDAMDGQPIADVAPEWTTERVTDDTEVAPSDRTDDEIESRLEDLGYL